MKPSVDPGAGAAAAVQRLFDDVRAGRSHDAAARAASNHSPQPGPASNAHAPHSMSAYDSLPLTRNPGGASAGAGAAATAPAPSAAAAQDAQAQGQGSGSGGRGPSRFIHVYRNNGAENRWKVEFGFRAPGAARVAAVGFGVYREEVEAAVGHDAAQLWVGLHRPDKGAADEGGARGDGGAPTAAIYGDADGHATRLNFPALRLHQDAALVAQLRGAGELANGKPLAARQVIRDWVERHKSALMDRLQTEDPASLAGETQGPKRARHSPAGPPPPGGDQGGAGGEDEGELGLEGLPPQRRKVYEPGGDSLEALVEAARQAGRHGTGGYEVADDGALRKRVHRRQLGEGVHLGYYARRLLGLPHPCSSVRVLCGPGGREESCRLRQRPQDAAVLACQGLLRALGVSPGDTVVLRRADGSADRPAISLALEKSDVAPINLAHQIPPVPAAPMPPPGAAALASGQPPAPAAAGDDAHSQLLQLEAAMEAHDLPAHLINSCVDLLYDRPERLAAAHSVITAAAAGGADACLATATKLLRHLELLRVLEQAGVNAGDAERCAQLHAQLSGSGLAVDEASAARVHGMVVTEAWGGGGGGEGAAAAVRHKVRACLDFF